MAISISKIQEAARSRSLRFKTLAEANILGMKTAFLCHSHLDKDLVEGVASLLNTAGWNVYIDWEDANMPQSPNKETASKIKQKIENMNYFLFLSTQNSTSSKWCPWEIGYADGKKNNDKILIIPTENNGTTYGSEYMQLYRRVDLGSSGLLEVFNPENTYTSTSFKSL